MPSDLHKDKLKISLIFSSSWDKIASAARNWSNSIPPRSSDDLCLLFCVKYKSLLYGWQGPGCPWCAECLDLWGWLQAVERQLWGLSTEHCCLRIVDNVDDYSYQSWGSRYGRISVVLLENSKMFCNTKIGSNILCALLHFSRSNICLLKKNNQIIWICKLLKTCTNTIPPFRTFFIYIFYYQNINIYCLFRGAC